MSAEDFRGYDADFEPSADAVAEFLTEELCQEDFLPNSFNDDDVSPSVSSDSSFHRLLSPIFLRQKDIRSLFPCQQVHLQNNASDTKRKQSTSDGTDESSPVSTPCKSPPLKRAGLRTSPVVSSRSVTITASNLVIKKENVQMPADRLENVALLVAEATAVPSKDKSFPGHRFVRANRPPRRPIPEDTEVLCVDSPEDKKPAAVPDNVGSLKTSKTATTTGPAEVICVDSSPEVEKNVVKKTGDVAFGRHSPTYLEATVASCRRMAMSGNPREFPLWCEAAVLV
ncbi:expressed unknown protein [Seminavis robusta]|uniref:Uncharacterized protein n=1 Tax=Seminavis robusta TaxID=568900 RepID=A0A9N8HZQ4_9STRA|nr:expressed unknown protein [Seminavis robusta]|eukprot:Sro3908_g351840.1 n/a (284) ;mRNA; f:3130-3981